MTRTQRNILWMLGLSVVVVYCCLMLVLTSVLNPNSPQDTATKQGALVVSTATPLPAPSSTLVPSPTLKPSPTQTARPTDKPTPRPTIPPGWNCYKSIGNKFTFARPAQWTLHSENADGAIFDVPPDGAPFYIDYIDTDSPQDITLDKAEPLIAGFSVYPYTRYRRGSSGTWTSRGQNGIYSDFYVASVNDSSYLRGFIAIMPNPTYGAIILAYFKMNAANFSATEMNTLHAISDSLGTCN